MNEQDQLQRAIEFAVTAHAGQTRKDAHPIQLPYIIHPLEVMREVYSFGFHEAEHLYILQAAILHDVIEDTQYTYGTLLDMFGERVADIVQELTFRDCRDGESRQDYQKAKSEHLGEFAQKSLEALIIKVADRICNVRDFERTDPQYAKKYFDKASGLWTALGKRGDEIRSVYGDAVFKSIHDKLIRFQWFSPGVERL